MEEYLDQDVKSIKIVYTALIVGVIFFLSVALFLNLSGNGLGFNDKTMEIGFLIMGNIIGFIAIPVGINIFKKRTKNIENLDYLNKIETFRSAMIIRAAVVEGPAFFFIVGYLLMGKTIFFLEAVITLAILIYFFPTNMRISKEMKVDTKDLTYK